MRATRAALLAAGVALLATLGALALKSWCGVPGAGDDLYLRWCYSDIPPLWFIERLDQGAVPYLDHPVEYPVLTGLWMWLAALPASSAGTFLLWTGALLAASAAATAALLAREVGLPRAALAFAAAPTLLVSGAVNWDLPAVALAAAGLVAHRRARDGLSGALLGLGTAAKLFPGLFLVPAAAAAWRLRGRRAGLTTVLAGAVAWWAVNVPVALAAPEGWLRFFELSRERPSDWDALWTVAMRLTGWSPTVPTLNLGTALAFLAGAGALAVVAARGDPPATWHLASLPLLTVFLLTSKVYSPQFSLWLLPLFALAFPGWGWLAAFAVADVAVTVTRFPYLANFVDGGLDGAWSWAPFATAVVVRALVLSGAAWVGWRRAVAGATP
ncbi:MAG: DUF2029 domain-containing protein [Actinobacteria bacterium]|nr:DUF2029 domain-containing protein [Actinomycetota bacterium]